MKKLFSFSLLMLFFSLSSCNLVNNELAIDSFEGDLNPTTVDFGASKDSFVKVTADGGIKICGNQSMKVEYDLKSSGYMWIARGYNLDVKGANKWLVSPDKISWAKFNAFSIYMYGAGTNGIIAFDIKDRYGEMWRFILDDNFKGWKEIICPFSEFFARTDWQPEKATKNDLLDFPIMSFQFEPRTPGKNVFYFDRITLKNIKK